MKKRTRRLLALLLSVVLVSTCVTGAAFAAYDPNAFGSVNDEAHNASRLTKGFYNATDTLIDILGVAITSLMPDQAAWAKGKGEAKTAVMAGDETFIDEPAAGARWSVGYDSASLLEGQNVLDGNHYVGGTLKFNKKVATSVEDDLRVRTVAMDDGSGRGVTVFAVVDGFGLSATDVWAIREEMADFCAEKNVKSLNISVLHQHSAVDTLGLNGNFWTALFGNPWRNLFGQKPVSGQTDSYMRHLYDSVEATVENAVANMTTGALYYGKVSLAEYVRDKRDPQVLDPFMERFRFVPDDGGREIWLSTSNIHCVGNGAGGTLITGDYPYYMEQYINAQYNADFCLILGAEQGTTQDHSTIEYEDDGSVLGSLPAYGEALARRLASVENETEVAPILNIAHRQVAFDISNKILILAGKGGLTTNPIRHAGIGKYQELSEIGYMEIGRDVAVAIVPGEAAAELFYGGACPADKSWSGEAWTLDPIADAAPDKDLIVFGLMNDMVGYIIPDNDYMPILYPENSSLEVVALGDTVASTMTNALAELISAVG